MIQVLGKVYDHERSDSWATQIRKQRLSLFTSLVNTLPKPIKILDVGGRISFWESAGFLNGEVEDIEITVLNLSVAECGTVQPKIKQVIGDARNMEQFQTNEFDIVFSNSVIEHVGTYEDQRRMANEVMRVGKRYFIQTPYLYFPIEPHFVFPFFQFLPINIRVWLVRNFDLGWYKKVTDKQTARNLVTEINLLNTKKFVNLFPKATLYKEKFLVLTKSLILYDGWSI